jgi:hypothetical protein
VFPTKKLEILGTNKIARSPAEPPRVGMNPFPDSSTLANRKQTTTQHTTLIDTFAWE